MSDTPTPAQALRDLLATVKTMKNPQTIADVGLLILKFAPVIEQAERALAALRPEGEAVGRSEAVVTAADQMRASMESARLGFATVSVAHITEWRQLLVEKEEALLWAAHSANALRGRVEALTPPPAPAQAKPPLKMLVDRDQLRTMIEQSPDEDCEAGCLHPEAPAQVEAAPLPAPGGVVGVKALEWQIVRSFGGDKLRAKTIAGEWWIEPAKNAADQARVERQKLACNAENEARIIAALAQPRPEQVEDEAVDRWSRYERIIEAARQIGCDKACFSFDEASALIAAARARPAPKPAGDVACTVIDLDKSDFDALCKAATESNWIPPEYYRNDWISDCCRFLREGPQVFIDPAPANAAPASVVSHEPPERETQQGLCVTHETQAPANEREGA
jgi:hypothetical protein